MKSLIVILAAFVIEIPLFVGCASQQKKETASLHQQMGRAFLTSSNYASAIKEFIVADEFDPNNAKIKNDLGLAYMLREKYDLAEREFKKALALENEYTDARNNLGWLLVQQKNYDAAIAELLIARRDLTYQDGAKVLLNLGIAYFHKKEFLKARDSFFEALKDQRENCQMHSWYGRSLFELQQFEDGAKSLDRAVGFCKRLGFDEPHYYSALSYLKLKDISRAEARLEEVIKLYPKGNYQRQAQDTLEIIRNGR